MNTAPLPFCNNLKRGDVVLDAKTRVRGTVQTQPRDDSRTVVVEFPGRSPLRVDVMDLRLVIDGKAEDVPPVDGEPPAPIARPANKTYPRQKDFALDPVEADPSSALKAQRSAIAREISALEEKFKALKVLDERLAKAIAVLEGAP